MKAFWTWVKANRHRLVAGAEESAIDELAAKLQEVEPALTIQLTADGKSTPRLAIGCNGDEDLIPAVKRLVESAGTIEGLKVVAFGQRLSPKTLEIDVDGFQLKATEMRFRLADEPSHFDRLALTVFIKAPRVTEELAEASMIIVEAVLGEFELMTGIGSVEVEPLPAKRNDLLPLDALAATFDGWDR
ncbi:MAG: hypothetical protein QM817_17715 [Archangium sp.]